MALIQILKDQFGNEYQAKHCKDCEEIKPVTMFRKSGKYYNSYCKDCFKIRNRACQNKRYQDPNIREKIKEKRLAKNSDSD
jgi:hypothetical protein